MTRQKAAAVLLALSLFFAVPIRVAAQESSMESRVYPLILPAGESVSLSAEYFEMRLGLKPGEIAAITITSLPEEGSGKLMLDGVEVQIYDTIFRSELDRLCYVQDENALAASSGWFSFIPLCTSQIHGKEDVQKVCATFQIREQEDTEERPIVQDVFCHTSAQTPVSAALSCMQGEVVYTISRKPAKGTVSFEDGRCVYTPQEGQTGSDSFVLTALDEQGRVSAPIRVSVAIQK